MSDVDVGMSGRAAAAVPASTSLVQARLRLALEAAQMGLWDWDVTTGELVWDERSAAMYGTTLAQSTGSIADVDARVHPQDLPRVRAELSGALESLGAVDVEFRVVWPDGSVHWLYGRGQALVDQRGVAVRLIGVNVDVTDQRQAARERAADLARMAALVAVAQRLGDADSEAQVLAIVAERGAALLGVQAALLVLTDRDAGQVRSLTTTGFVQQEQVADEVAVLPFGFPLPMVHTAQTGAAHFLPDRAAALALFPGGEEVYRRAGTQGSASVPLHARGAVFGALAVAFTGRHDWRAADRELLEALAALAGQALDRILAQRAEREATRASRRLSETLQRSLLTAPPQPDCLQIGVRYQPAASDTQVGGDWYDAFVTDNGNTTLVVGDVTGHDQHAAAMMAQLRNVLRGVAQTLSEPPAAALTALDGALSRLHVGTLATAVLCQVERSPQQPRAAQRLLRWSNAGHPPPLLLQPDGTSRYLTAPPDLLLGLEPDTARTDHQVLLDDGATVVLYTDGLIERRHQSLDTGLDQLRTVASQLHTSPVEQLCDALLEGLADNAQDDIALLVLRVDSRHGGAAAGGPAGARAMADDDQEVIR